MRHLVLRSVAAAVVAVAFAAPAGAGTLTVGLTPGGFGFTYTAGAGETNNVQVSRVSATDVKITDTAGITLSGATGCTATNGQEVHCDPSLPIQSVDVITLGDQNDILFFNAGNGFPGVGVVVRADGGAGFDKLTGGPGDDVIDLGPDNDDYADGAGGNDTLSGGDGNEILFGGDGNDTLSGGNGTDTITGNTGNDYVDGGAGSDLVAGGPDNDRLQGGSGLDTYQGEDGDDILERGYDPDTYSGGPGFDTVDYTSWDSFDPGCFPMFSCPIGVHVTVDGVANDGSDDLDNDGGSFAAKDNVGNDVEAIVGTKEADALNGGAGALDQTFTGAGGNDSIAGGPGSDTVADQGDVNWNLDNTSLTGLGTDTLSGIEHAVLRGGDSGNSLVAAGFTLGSVTLYGDAASPGHVACAGCNTPADILVGSPQGDQLYGDAPGFRVAVGATTTDYVGTQGNDQIYGFGGNDTFNGDSDLAPTGGFPGVGNDQLQGEIGNDAFNGGAGNDIVIVETDALHANLTLTNSTLTGAGSDTVSGIDFVLLTGDAGINTLDASASSIRTSMYGGASADTLNGGSGADSLSGAEGNDSVDGGAGIDTVAEFGDTNFTLSDASLVSPLYGTDTLAHIELGLFRGGASANVMNASDFSGSVSFYGDPGPDTLTGGPGADTLVGDDGSDVLSGGGGNDSLDGGVDSVNDVLNGGGGTNKAVGSGDVNWILTNASLTGHGVDTLSEIQTAALTGGAGGNTLDAKAFTLGGVTLNGAGGADVLLGGSGPDTLLGGDGPDTLTGGAGVDAFEGGVGDDMVKALDFVTEVSITCGDGADAGILDMSDVVGDDCESVSRPDVRAPNTTLRSGPRARTTSHTARFVFRSTEAHSTFQCKLDRRAWRSCKSPKTYRKLKTGRHTFRVRAKDAAGNLDATPAKKTWRIR